MKDYFLITGPMSQHAIKLFIRTTPKDRNFRTRWESIAPLTEENSEATIIVVDQFVQVDDSFVRQFPKLRYVVSPTTGQTHLTHTFDGIKTLTLKGETRFLQNIRSVSELVFYYILRFSRFHMSPARSINGATIGIVGCGRIGKHVRQIAKAFQMNVIIWDKKHSKRDLEKLFSKSDYISIHLPESSSTKGLISKKLLRMMKPEAFFINTSRSSIIEEAFLLNLSAKSKIGGCALDVISRQDILLELWNSNKISFQSVGDKSRIIYSSHIGGSTFDDRVKTDEFMVTKLGREIKHQRQLSCTKPTMFQSRFEKYSRQK